jgi:hypothetical protein
MEKLDSNSPDDLKAQTENEIVSLQRFYRDDVRAEFLSRSHFAIAAILQDYGLTQEEVASEIIAVSKAVNPEIFLISEDDVPKVILIRIVEGHLAKKNQKSHLRRMIENISDLADRKTLKGLTDVIDRDRYLEIKKVKKNDPEFCYHLVIMDTHRSDLLDPVPTEFVELRPGVDSVNIYSMESIIELSLLEETEIETSASFDVDKSQFFSYSESTEYPMVSMLLPVDEYVKGTYPIGVNLFKLNPRLFLSKSAGPNKSMRETLESEESRNFHILNNGITGVCDSIKIKESSKVVHIEVTNLQIVNGCQTTETIWAWARHSVHHANVLVPLRLVQAGKNADLAQRISLTTNSQSAIAAADLIANHESQKRVKNSLNDYQIFYESRRGEWRKLTQAERSVLRRHKFTWLDEEVARIGLREMGQALLSVSGKPNQAKEQIAGLFKIQNRGTYDSIFVDSWESPSQIAFVSLLYIYLRDVNRWVKSDASKDFYTLAGLGRFYVMYLIYEYWRKGDGAFVGIGGERSKDQQYLVDAESSSEWITDFDPDEINQLANLAVKALEWVLKNSEGAIDGNRALLRQGAHKTDIENRFRTLIDVNY